MKLTFEEIRSALTGAVSAEVKEGALHPYRFTEEQMVLYENRPRYKKRHTNGAGIRLFFQTNSTRLFLKLNVSDRNNPPAFAADVFINGAYYDCIRNFEEPLPENYHEQEYPFGIFEKEFSLGEGLKTVTVYLPYAYEVEIMEVALEDGASFEPIKRPKKLLVFGDSITQGYNSVHSSVRYASRLADFLDAEEFNKGVAGETFFPELAGTKEDFEPDYITVSYGTNDWNKSAAPQELPANCRRFYESVSRLYPHSQIFALTPVWCAAHVNPTAFGPFEKVAELIREVTEPLPNVTVIDGFRLIPGDLRYFGDKLHPNDDGFSHFAENLCKEIKKHLK